MSVNVKSHDIKKDDKDSDVKEPFCGACVSLPLALAGPFGVGMSAKSHRKNKKTMFIISLIIALVGLAIGIYYYKNCKNCR